MREKNFTWNPALFRLVEPFGAHSRHLEEIMNERVVAISPIECRTRQLVLLLFNGVSYMRFIVSSVTGGIDGWSAKSRLE